MRDWRRRLLYLFGAFVVTLFGLASRRYGSKLPGLIAEYAGDTLWALMVFLVVSVLLPQLRVSMRAAIALCIACAVEVSQLYHAPWIDAIRGTTIGGLVLGFGFLWTDLLCYTLGVTIGAVAGWVVGYSLGIRSGGTVSQAHRRAEN